MDKKLRDPCSETFCTGLCWLPYPMQVTMVSGIHTDSRMEPGRLGMSLCRVLAQHEQGLGSIPRPLKTTKQWDAGNRDVLYDQRSVHSWSVDTKTAVDGT